MSLDSPYFDHLRKKIGDFGGTHNAHLHLDRSGTLFEGVDDKESFQLGHAIHLSLPEKHKLFSSIHDSPNLEQTILSKRVNFYLDAMVRANTARADTLVDVTASRIGLSTLEEMLRIKQTRQSDIDLRLASYTPMGFIDSEPERWDVFKQGAELADFIGSLPERDDKKRYPEHIGFFEHCMRLVELSVSLNKPLQIHLDQHNDPRENETEIFLRAVEKVGYSPLSGAEPLIWIIHFISPAHYPYSRLKELLGRLVDLNIGVICCPSAALSMRQLKLISTPTGNSIAPVLEMLEAGIYLCIGSDNIADICSPAGTPDLIDEIYVLANALRFYDIDILAKLASGRKLDPTDRELISEHLEHNLAEMENAQNYHPPI